uniref:Reverse transcriptase domain-containing protein n=1 Tax=Tanacetum cinerariifolium TaxID=118510 RepID=A0A6L2LFU6_TANCI|nr:reverse transcriptase domain-containing protein [Tanacetum cinerariifolium]
MGSFQNLQRTRNLKNYKARKIANENGSRVCDCRLSGVVGSGEDGRKRGNTYHNFINSFDDMMRKFLLKYFPPSMVTKLRNEITKFEQKPHKSLFEAWERYKLSIDRCPNHNMLLVTQIDTFYNGLRLSHRDTINAAAGGTFLQKTPEDCYELIKNITTHHNHWDTSAIRDETSRNISYTSTIESLEVVRQLEMMNKNFLEMMRQFQMVKTVDTKCETSGGPHSFTEYPAVGGYTHETAYATTGNYNSEGNSYQPQAITTVNENGSTVILKKLLEKLGDPGIVGTGSVIVNAVRHIS